MILTAESLVELGHSIREAAEILGVKKSTVYHRLRRAGVSAGEPPKRLTDETRAAIRRHLNFSVPYRTIAMKFRVSLRTIHVIRYGADSSVAPYRCRGCGYLVTLSPCLICETRAGQ